MTQALYNPGKTKDCGKPTLVITNVQTDSILSFLTS